MKLKTAHSRDLSTEMVKNSQGLLNVFLDVNTGNSLPDIIKNSFDV